jgi:hypothetical protein
MDFLWPGCGRKIEFWVGKTLVEEFKAKTDAAGIGVENPDYAPPG